MKNIFYLTTVLFLLTTSNQCLSQDCNRYIKFGNSDKKEIFYYSKHVIGIDNYFTYSCSIVITNYENKSMTVKDFWDIALKFLDTIKFDKQISNVLFLGQVKDGYLPDTNYCFNDEERKFAIISLGFDNNFPQNANKKQFDLHDLTFWKKGKPKKEIYLMDSAKKNEILSSDKKVDNN